MKGGNFDLLKNMGVVFREATLASVILSEKNPPSTNNVNISETLIRFPNK